ncbi:cytochrome b [Rhodobacterales bacterium HKCCE2091]|nr:cytochrome b [Rhodobacterales bacterium HKCCE2091]
MTTKTGYSTVQIALHWLVAALIAAAWFTSDGMGHVLRQVEDGADPGGPYAHVLIGIAVLVLVLARLAARVTSGAPAPAAARGSLPHLAAVWGHRLLYVLMLAVPALGIATFFGGIHDAGDLHETLANLLMLVVLGHAAAGIFHQWVLKDGTLTRMVRPGA